MMNDDCCDERQKNELDALKSIFGDDLINLANDGDGDGDLPLHILLRLRPLQSSSGNTEAYVKLNLRVECSKNYPNEIPHLFLENIQGLSDANVSELLNELITFSESHKGDEIIFQLAQHAQEFLHKHNAKPPGSFYEQMLYQQKLRQENDTYIASIQEKEKRQELENKILKRREILKNEEVKDAMSLKSLNDKDDRCTKSSEESAQLLKINKCQKHQFTLEIELSNRRKIIRGCCVDHSELNITTYIALDLCTGDPLLLTEYIVDCTPAVEKRYCNAQNLKEASLNYMNQLLINIEPHLNKLIHLRHANIVPYEDYTCCLRNNSIIIYLLQPFLVYSKMIDTGAHDLAEQLLKALSYLHANNISHGNLIEKSVIVDSTGCVRLKDFGTQLINCSLDTPINLQKDIYDLGEMLKKLAYVENDPDLWHFIKACQYADQRTSADILLQHQYICLENTYKINQLSMPSPEPIIKENLALNCLQNSNKSRILSEFTEIMKIGNGAFGDVLKVRNNLDGSVYAIKRIPLNPRNKQLYGKITREVKLLSKLYHDNVVRYYNSWIETAKMEDSRNLNYVDINDEKSWSVTYEARKSQTSANSSVEDGSDSDDYITFLHGSKSSCLSTYSTDMDSKGEQNLQFRFNNKDEMQYMYIQMEFCDKSTLRTAIDDGLSMNADRCRRLFREIIEGLAHIHQQGMIHRDLKPVNIFIDSRDHVKIGDFGLATTSVIARNVESQIQPKEKKYVKKNVTSNTNISLTGQVGTALYVAPELLQSGQKVQYNEKVDIYSLGIILFEMIYPFKSMMERAKVLQGLRLPTILMPTDVPERFQQQIPLINWLLNHDALQRPSSSELLVSDLVPPVRLEDRNLFEMIKLVLNNPKGKPYKHLVVKCLEQRNDESLDITYHVDENSKNLSAQWIVKKIITEVFQKHGAIDVSTPLLTPANLDNDLQDSYVKLMTHNGCVVILPANLRHVFARYAAFCDLRSIRRFAISHVYSERRVFGFHPRQNLECAMDILMPVSTEQDFDHTLLLVQAELISIASEVVAHFPALQQSHRSMKLHLNHSDLIQAALIYSSAPKDKKKQIFALLNDYRGNKINKYSVQMFLCGLGIRSSNLNLLDFIDSETIIGSDCQISTNTVLGILLKARGEVGKQVKDAIAQIESVAKLALYFGVQCSMYIHPGFKFDTEERGLSWRLICDGECRKSCKGDVPVTVLAVGERYDQLLYKLRQRYGQFSTEDGIIALGVTLYPENFLQTIIRESENVALTSLKERDTFVAANDPYLLKDAAQILRRLWVCGIKASPLISSHVITEDELLMYSHCCLIIPCGGGEAIIKYFDNERFQEKKMALPEICEYILRSVSNTANDELTGAYTFPCNYDEGGPQLNILIVPNERIYANQRRRYEHQAKCHMSRALSRLNSRCSVQVFCLNLRSNEMTTLADKIYDARGERALNEAVLETIELYPKLKKYLLEVAEKILSVLSEAENSVLAFYSLLSYTYRILL
ncbi:eIF-2-alpha kinase GCN2 [Ctenocephalides felis]|uniref:eIF-2-alpha kinase GCN2 n=1 Tax=Ctenocephalides felis TaxID=7515 RepID=UPI000E6E146D|nr:eIF-2-alpha kinase GCN2 [Ctenocephalides felis]